MEALTLNQIAAAVHGRLLGEGFDAEQTVSEVCTDSRKIKKGCLFRVFSVEAAVFCEKYFLNFRR